MQTLLRLPMVKARTGLSRSTIYFRVAEGTFPAPVKLGAGARAVGWVEAEIEQWLLQQISQSREYAPGSSSASGRKADA